MVFSRNVAVKENTTVWQRQNSVKSLLISSRNSKRKNPAGVKKERHPRSMIRSVIWRVWVILAIISLGLQNFKQADSYAKHIAERT